MAAPAGAGSLGAELSVPSRRAPESPRAAGAREKRKMMQSRSRGCMLSLSAPGGLLSLDKHRLMPLILWLNISFTSKFVLGKGNELLSKQKHSIREKANMPVGVLLINLLRERDS